jgi:hypothetical protein
VLCQLAAPRIEWNQFHSNPILKYTEILRKLTGYYQNPVSLYKILPLPGGSARPTRRQKRVTNLILNVPSFQNSWPVNFKHSHYADCSGIELDAC